MQLIILLGQPFPSLQTGKKYNYLNFNKLTLADTAEETPPTPNLTQSAQLIVWDEEVQ